jgi:thioredoxin-like negative regulator of GroEL
VTTIELLLDAERALVAGLLDRAERTYRQVLAAEPENAIAIVGLARVALERGDEATALELGRRALAADPENVAASRLVARLEEVRAARTAPAEAAGQRRSAGVAASTPPSTPPSADADTPARRRGRGWLDRLLRRR